MCVNRYNKLSDSLSDLPLTTFQFLHHQPAANKQRGTLVQLGGYLFKDPLMAICGPATCYLYYVSQRITFIEQSQFAVWIFRSDGINKNASFDQVAMHISHHT